MWQKSMIQKHIQCLLSFCLLPITSNLLYHSDVQPGWWAVFLWQYTKHDWISEEVKETQGRWGKWQGGTFGFVHLRASLCLELNLWTCRKPSQRRLPGDDEEEALVQCDPRQRSGGRLDVSFPTGNEEYELFKSKHFCLFLTRWFFFWPCHSNRSCLSTCVVTTTAPNWTWRTSVGCFSELWWIPTGRGLTRSPKYWKTWSLPTKSKSWRVTTGRR